jgi:RimJ/RimL family protein N-acetyltransferase
VDAGVSEVPPEFRNAMRNFQHPSMVLYLVRDGEQAVGGGASYIFDGVLGLTGTATVPAHRGRGVQHAVVQRMLHDARGRAELAMATVEPGSRSQRAFERFGFRVVYTRAIFVRPYRLLD